MDGPPTTCIDRTYRADLAPLQCRALRGELRCRDALRSLRASLLRRRRGRRSRPGAELIEPMADLASSTPHSACACGGGAMYGRAPASRTSAAEPRSASAAAPVALARPRRGASSSARRRFDRTRRAEGSRSATPTGRSSLLLPLALIALLRGAPHDRRALGEPPGALLDRARHRARLPRARDRDQRGRAPPPRRAAAPDRARVRRQRRLPRPARARDAGRRARRARTPASCSRRRSGSSSPGCLAAASAVEYRLETSLWIVRHGRAAARARPRADRRPGRSSRSPSCRRCSDAGHAGGGRRAARRGRARSASSPTRYAAFAYFRIYHRRRSGLAFAVAFAFALLAEALVVAVALAARRAGSSRWWEWHGLMVIGFVSIGAAAWREWYEERFSALYLDETLRGHKEVSVLFADLAGFTPFTEAHGSAEVHAMLVTYFGRLAPMIRDEFDGEVHEFVGDQIFAVFNKAGDQPDHARARRAGRRSRSSASRPRSARRAPRLAALPRRHQHRRGARRRRRRPRPPHPRRLRRHGQPRRAARGPGAASDGVMIGAATFEQLPPGAVVERRPTCRSRARPSRSSPTSCTSVPCASRARLRVARLRLRADRGRRRSPRAATSTSSARSSCSKVRGMGTVVACVRVAGQRPGDPAQRPPRGRRADPRSTASPTTTRRSRACARPAIERHPRARDPARARARASACPTGSASRSTRPDAARSSADRFGGRIVNAPELDDLALGVQVEDHRSYHCMSVSPLWTSLWTIAIAWSSSASTCFRSRRNEPAASIVPNCANTAPPCTPSSHISLVPPPCQIDVLVEQVP